MKIVEHTDQSLQIADQNHQAVIESNFLAITFREQVW
jgi:hypothetical protein